MTVSLGWINLPVNKTRSQRNELFFGIWRYCARFVLSECHALRRLDHVHIEKTVQQLRLWGRRMSANPGGSWRYGWVPLEITNQDVDRLHAMCTFLQTESTARQIVLHGDHFFLYTNHAELFDRISRLGLARLTSITEAETSGLANTIMIKNSAWQQRSYFRARKLCDKTALAVKSFLLAQQSVRLSPSLLLWCQQDRRWTDRHFFIDHNQTAVISMLGFIIPDLVRVTRDISTAK